MACKRSGVRSPLAPPKTLTNPLTSINKVRRRSICPTICPTTRPELIGLGARKSARRVLRFVCGSQFVWVANSFDGPRFIGSPSVSVKQASDWQGCGPRARTMLKGKAACNSRFCNPLQRSETCGAVFFTFPSVVNMLFRTKYLSSEGNPDWSTCIPSLTAMGHQGDLNHIPRYHPPQCGAARRRVGRLV